jgi:hypothetical protein
MRDFENAIRESQQRLAPNFDAFSPGEVDHLLGKGTFMANLYKEACHRVANLPY